MGVVWSRRIGLLGAMREGVDKPDVISFSAAMSACAKGGLARRTLGLLEEMILVGILVAIKETVKMDM